MFLDFNLENLDRYPHYFREDSIVTLAEAGTFKGLDGIFEYFQLGRPQFNLILDDNMSEQLAQELQFVGFEDGHCIFRNYYRFRFSTDTFLTTRVTT